MANHGDGGGVQLRMSDLLAMAMAWAIDLLLDPGTAWPGTARIDVIIPREAPDHPAISGPGACMEAQIQIEPGCWPGTSSALGNISSECTGTL